MFEEISITFDIKTKNYNKLQKKLEENLRKCCFNLRVKCIFMSGRDGRVKQRYAP